MSNLVCNQLFGEKFDQELYGIILFDKDGGEK